LPLKSVTHLHWFYFLPCKIRYHIANFDVVINTDFNVLHGACFG